MKLNAECIRDILFAVEEYTSLDSTLKINPKSLPENLSKYAPDTLLYHVKQCELSGLFVKVDWYLDGSCRIYYLSPEGHKFISNMRADNAWSKTKDIAGKIGANSIDILKEIGSSVITALIQGYLVAP